MGLSWPSVGVKSCVLNNKLQSKSKYLRLTAWALRLLESCGAHTHATKLLGASLEWLQPQGNGVPWPMRHALPLCPPTVNRHGGGMTVASTRRGNPDTWGQHCHFVFDRGLVRRSRLSKRALPTNVVRRLNMAKWLPGNTPLTIFWKLSQHLVIILIYILPLQTFQFLNIIIISERFFSKNTKNIHT